MNRVDIKNRVLANLSIRVVMMIIIIGVGVLSCKDDKNSNGNNTEQPENNGSSNNGNNNGNNTVASYLAQFGLTEDDIKPAGFVSFEGPDGWLIKVNASENQFDNWAKKVFDKIKTISTDGKVYDQGYPTFKEEASLVNGATLYQWAYPYKGKTVEVDVTRGDTPTLYRIALHFQ